MSTRWRAADEVLCVRLDGAGDVLMTSPALRALREAKPGRRITLLTSEAGAVAALFPPSLHAGSTKGWTGHTLGAAGIVESVFALLALQHGLLPGTLNSVDPDPVCAPQIRFDNASRPVRLAMNNSFGFGGNNCSLLFGRPA